MFGKTTKVGFTLLEILITIAIIALLSTIVIPNFLSMRPRYEREAFIARLNALVKFGWQNALITHSMHQVSFNVEKHAIQLLQAEGRDAKGELVFKKVQNAYLNTTIPIPDNLEIKNFYIDGTGFDEMSKFVGKKTGEVWFFIVPEGLAQEVIINILDSKDRMYDGKPRPIGLVLNPFLVRFKEYDTFQK